MLPRLLDIHRRSIETITAESWKTDHGSTLYRKCRHHRICSAQARQSRAAGDVTEQIESTHAAYEAGAALVHVHVRNDDETPSSDPEKFAAFQERIRRHCPDIIVQFSTGGRGRAMEQRGSMLYLRPEMTGRGSGRLRMVGYALRK
jgi:hypothetical protein